MPTNWLYTDNELERIFSGTTEQQLRNVQNYLAMLVRELRHTLQNLGLDNFNSTELERLIAEIKKRTDA